MGRRSVFSPFSQNPLVSRDNLGRRRLLLEALEDRLLLAVEIAAVSPSSGPIGTVVGISGSGLSNVSEVTFTQTVNGNHYPADFVVVSDGELRATVPLFLWDETLIRVRDDDGLSLTFPANPTVVTGTRSVGGSTQVVIKSGGNLTGAGGSVIVFVESGGNVNLGGGSGGQTFYVKSGGTLEYAGGGNVFYEPGATINALNSQLMEVSSLHLVLGVTFQTDRNNDPIASDDSYYVAQDRPLVVDAAAGVLVNDDDADGGVQILIAEIQADPINGTVELSADGSFTYTPHAAFLGEDTFTYSNYDGKDDSNIATVTLNVVEDIFDFGDAPLPYPTTLADDGARHSLQGPMLGSQRDTELDGQPATSADGDGDDEDGVHFGPIIVGQVDAGVTVNVQNAPADAKLDAWIDFNVDGAWDGPGEHIFDSVRVVNGDNALRFDVPSWVLAGNTYARFRLSTEGDLGVGGLAADGEVEDYQTTIDPPLPDPSLMVSIDDYTAGEDQLLSVPAESGVLANDFDTQGGSLSAVLEVDALHGELVLRADGSFSYLPEENFFGIDNFSYRAIADSRRSVPAIVTITVEPVNDAPVAVDDTYIFVADSTLEVALPGVLMNDADAEGDALTASLVDDVQNGTLQLSADGSFTYTPNEGFFGTDTFTYNAHDGQDSSNVATAVLQVPRLQTFDDPTVTSGDNFGNSVAIYGNQLLIAAYADDTNGINVGQAHLFDATTGGLLQTFDDPTVTTSDLFGYSVAIDRNHVLIGARDDQTNGDRVGQAYLFDATTGGLLQTFNDPTLDLYGNFGQSVAIDGNKVLIASQYDDANGWNVGQVYLFDATSGNLLQTFDDPTPTTQDLFGNSVAIDGNLVLIGASGDDTNGTEVGQAHLFDASTGDLLQTFDDPTVTSWSYFGSSVAIDRNIVLIGAIGDHNNAASVGRAYLFDATTGDLLHTLNDPTARSGNGFGLAVAIDRNNALIGAKHDDTNGADVGQAYLFDVTTGELRFSLVDPTVTSNDNFGGAVAIDGNSVLIGAAGDRSSGVYVGQAHLFTIGPTINDAPPAVDDAYDVAANSTLEVALPGVLMNDSDTENEVLTAVLVEDVSSGELVLNDDGSFTYTPDAGFFGTDSFTYRANDGRHNGEPAVVTIVVGGKIVDVALVALPQPSGDDSLGELPSSLSQITAGTTYFVEIWVQDVDQPGAGLSGGTVDLAYTSAPADVTAIFHGRQFNLLKSGQIDDAIGLVDDFGGGSFSSGVGMAPQWARLGYVEVSATGAGQVTFSLDRGLLEFSRFGAGFVDWNRVDLSGTVTLRHTGSTVRLDAAVVRSASETDRFGEVAAVPASAAFLHEWESFWVEVWGSTPQGSDAGIAGATFDLLYNTSLATATRIEYGPAFGESQSGAIDDDAGIVRDVGASATRGDVGDDRPVLLARVLFEPAASDGAVVDALGHRVGPYDLGIELANVRTAAVTTEIGPAPQTELWAVIYDVDDSDIVNFGDFSFFAEAFEHTIFDAEPPLIWWADFDKSGLVDFGDFSFFTANLLADKNGGAVTFPDNYPEAWRPNAPAPGRAPEAAAAQAAGGGLEVQLVARQSLSAGDTAAALPDSLSVVSDAQTYFVEVWLRDNAPSASGITGGRVDVQYTSAAANVLTATSSDQFNVFANNSVDEPAGAVRGLGGGTFDAGVASGDQWARLGYVQLTATGDGPIRFTLNPGELQLSRFGGGNIPWNEVSLGTLSLNSTPADLTGNGFVDFQDLTILLANWNQNVSAAQGNLVDAATTPVNFEDLTVLLAAWTGPGPAASPQAAAAHVTTGPPIATKLNTESESSHTATSDHFNRLGRRDDVTLRRAGGRSELNISQVNPLRRLQAAAVDRALAEESTPDRERIFRRRAGSSARR